MLKLAPAAVAVLAWISLVAGSGFDTALDVLLVVHTIAPFWCMWVDRASAPHVAFARGPLLVFAVDVVFLGFAIVDDTWGDVTGPFAMFLFACAVIALAYAAAVVTVLAKLRAKRG